MTNPPNLNYCKIIGNFKAFIADSADGDDLPDFVPMTGTGQIWPNVVTAKNTDVGNKSTYFNSPISVTVDSAGDLAQGGVKYVMVLAGSSNLNPNNFNYSITLSLTAQGESVARTYGPYAFDVTAGGTIDLTDIIPVSASGGIPVIQGPQGTAGLPGDMVGVYGPSSVSGTVTLGGSDLPSTRLWTMTGNITLNLPTPSGATSGTISLVLTQDGTGGRTITWPAAVKWPDGIIQQPASAASAASMIHLLWTGTTWYGMVGGKSFA